ncbi:hypothetical protein A5647_21560 [Mycobacterium sp. 1100029.7]|nr:hypothetical protein A5647_21560 [Mycobacterium sp. 1100029.7]
MLLSFLATVEDGFSASTSMSRRAARSRHGRTDVAGKGGASDIASLLGLDINLSGQYTRKTAIESSVEEKSIREHTAASMFNKLYRIFKTHKIFGYVYHRDQLQELLPGHIVEISGTVGENPLEFLFDTVKALIPIIEVVGSLKQLTAAVEQGGGPTQVTNMGIDQLGGVIDQLRADVSSSPVTDIVLDAGFCRAIITASREFMTETARAALVGGSFTALGKVTRVGLKAPETISVSRRGSLAALGDVQTRLVEMIAKVQPQLASQVPDAVIEAPFVQIVPLAIYV